MIPQLKDGRLEILRKDSQFRFVKADLADREGDGRIVR